MKIGANVTMINPSGRPDDEVYHDELALIDLVEPLGFDSLMCVEHHFTGFAMIPNNTQLLAYVAGRTKRIQLVTDVIVLPWHDPIRVAEEIATLDVLSGGRTIFGFGRGAAPVEYDGFGVPMAESRQRFKEAAEIVISQGAPRLAAIDTSPSATFVEDRESGPPRDPRTGTEQSSPAGPRDAIALRRSQAASVLLGAWSPPASLSSLREQVRAAVAAIWAALARRGWDELGDRHTLSESPTAQPARYDVHCAFCNLNGRPAMDGRRLLRLNSRNGCLTTPSPGQAPCGVEARNGVMNCQISRPRTQRPPITA